MMLTREEMIERLLASRPNKPKPKPKPPAQIVYWPKPLSQLELSRRQAIIDATWERVLEERRALEEVASRTCHIGPGDPDWRR